MSSDRFRLDWGPDRTPSQFSNGVKAEMVAIAWLMTFDITLQERYLSQCADGGTATVRQTFAAR